MRRDPWDHRRAPGRIDWMRALALLIVLGVAILTLVGLGALVSLFLIVAS